MPKNIVICCDGTNNSYDKDLTNVARLSLIALRKENVQSAYYDAGVGVDAEPGIWTRLGRAINRGLGCAIGAGLVRNVKEAYLEIVKQYQPEARIFLFGFSRGAYTVRVLAGLLDNFGLLNSADPSLLETIVKRFQRLFPDQKLSEAESKSEVDRAYGEARSFKAAYCVDCQIAFLGLWDTVSSLGWLYSPKTFPNTASIPNAKIVRHAMAIDERRAKFRPNRVKHAGNLMEVWFSGVHCDVGGGYAESESELSKIPLAWLLDEAVKAGLQIDPFQRQRLVEGPLTRPDPYAEQHESLEKWWWLLEYVRLPHRKQVDGKWIEEMVRYKGNGWRTVQPGDLVHHSVQTRMSKKPIKNQNWPGDASINWLLDEKQKISSP
jgi:uncharacterized protein (DUF2235 family)